MDFKKSNIFSYNKLYVIPFLIFYKYNVFPYILSNLINFLIYNIFLKYIICNLYNILYIMFIIYNEFSDNIYYLILLTYFMQ